MFFTKYKMLLLSNHKFLVIERDSVFEDWRYPYYQEYEHHENSAIMLLYKFILVGDQHARGSNTMKEAIQLFCRVKNALKDRGIAEEASPKAKVYPSYCYQNALVKAKVRVVHEWTNEDDMLAAMNTLDHE